MLRPQLISDSFIFSPSQSHPVRSASIDGDDDKIVSTSSQSVVARYQSIAMRSGWLTGGSAMGLVAVGASRAFNAACEELIIRNGIREIGVCAWNALRGALAVKTSQCLQMSRILWVNFNSCPFAHFQHYWAHQIILSADGDQTTGRDQNNCRATENMN